jgi:hypothetical protein
MAKPTKKPAKSTKESQLVNPPQGAKKPRGGRKPQTGTPKSPSLATANQETVTTKASSPDVAAALPVEQPEKPATGVKCPKCSMVGLWFNSTSEEANGAAVYCSGCRSEITMEPAPGGKPDNPLTANLAGKRMAEASKYNGTEDTSGEICQWCLQPYECCTCIKP